MKIKILILAVCFYSLPLFANQDDYILMRSTSKQLGSGWSKVEELWGLPNSGYSTMKVIIKNPDGKPVKEYYNDFGNEDYFDNEPITSFIVTNDKLLISTYNSNIHNSVRHWEFEIINSESEQIFYKEYYYETPYYSFGLNNIIKTKKVYKFPHFIAVDDMYIYYVNDNFTTIIQKKIDFNEKQIVEDMMPTPRKIKYINMSIEVLFEFLTTLSSDSEDTYTVDIKIDTD